MIITISREFGSGGREIGKRLSELLNINFYDRKIITTIAQESKVDENYLEKVLESGAIKKHTYSFSRNLSRLPNVINNTPSLLALEHKIIKKIAISQDAVIVGRSADVILSDLNPLRIFIYAGLDEKLEEIKKRETSLNKMTDKELIKKIKEIDKSRAMIHDFVSSKPWKDITNYDLCINTSKIDVETAAMLIKNYAEKYYQEVRKNE